MKNIYLIFFIGIVSLLIVGCSVDFDKEKKQYEEQVREDIFVRHLCADGVVCYHIHDGYTGSGSCFRDADLVAKYCG